MDSRRDFIKKTSILGTGIAVGPSILFASSKAPSDKLSVGLIGVGGRGFHHMKNLLDRDDVNVTAICDIDPERINISLQKIKNKGGKKPEVYDTSETAYKKLLDSPNVDAVVISTPWLWHTVMTKDAMLAGKFAGVEVSAANTMEECWDLVNTHEKTGTHMMILENVNYRRDVLAVLNMVRQNVFGELVHFRCGYQHD